MRVKPLQVLWHSKLSIFSADFQPTTPLLDSLPSADDSVSSSAESAPSMSPSSGRLATCGADGFVRLWRIHPEQQHPVEFLASLQRHVGGVNVVRWSPDGTFLASAGDDGSICVWKPAAEGAAQSSRFGAQDDEEDQKENWILHCVLPGPREVVIYDLAWSPDGQYLITGSDMDNSARIWNLNKRKQVQVLDKCHQHFVQGVAWDPLGEFLVTQSSDRSVNIFTIKPSANENEELCVDLFTKSSKLNLPAASVKQTSPQPAAAQTLPFTGAQTPLRESSTVEEEEAPLNENIRPENTPHRSIIQPQTPKTPAVKRSMKIFHDETVLTFFRRLSFTPDGALLIVPTGIYRKSNSNDSASVNVTFIYARNRFKAGPCVFLPGYQRPSTLIRCNPIRYKLRTMDDGSERTVFALPYRYVFAVATLDSVFIYDTQQTQPIYQMSNLHYATLNDLAWSNDGRMLIITSADGYCSVACFDRGELGEVV